MTHPDLAELTEYATSESADPRTALHIETCAQCSSEVCRLRFTLGALLASTTVAPDGGPECFDEHRIAAFADGSLPARQREASVKHLAVCARCRGEVSSVARALSSSAVGGEVAALGARGRSRWLRFWVPLGAAAAAVLLLVVRPLPPPEDVPVHRERPAVVGPAPVTIAPEGPTSAVRVLRWHAVAGADRYRVTLFDGNGVVLWESALPDTVAPLPSDVTLEAGEPYYWIVSARTGFDRWNTSALAEFELSAGAER